ncbi:MAG: MBL fold metallo-hydrolase [bacterium]
MKITKYAQSCFLFEYQQGTTVLVDLGKYSTIGGDLPNRLAMPTLFIVTHGHEDHYYPDIIRAVLPFKHDIVIHTNEILAAQIAQDGFKPVPVTIGTKFISSELQVMPLRTDHVVWDKVVPNFGFLIHSTELILYYASDTRYIEPDILNLGCEIDLLIIPISNRGLVMGMDDVIMFASKIHPKVVIPMHYDSPKDKGRVNPNCFATLARKAGLNVKVIKNGKTAIF